MDGIIGKIPELPPMKERVRYACLDCPACVKTDNRKDDAIDAAGRRRVLMPFCYYCKAAALGYRKIANKADYTGNQPKWCPRLEADAE